MDKRKAQVFTIRHTGLLQPTIHYGKPTLKAQASLWIDFARSLSDVAVRVANEQIKCRVAKNTMQI
ncbi:MAG: hypothetical protein J5867_10050 [Prevotella sp.]|nr:hypothetical protein [Prevotella sp.]